MAPSKENDTEGLSGKRPSDNSRQVPEDTVFELARGGKNKSRVGWGHHRQKLTDKPSTRKNLTRRAGCHPTRSRPYWNSRSGGEGGECVIFKGHGGGGTRRKVSVRRAKRKSFWRPILGRSRGKAVNSYQKTTGSYESQNQGSVGDPAD